MHFRAFLSVSLLTLAGVAPAGSEETRARPRAVLELFTSQGCSNCPKADALLDELGRNSDYIALAYHVDYWDYRGWSDTYGAKSNSDHQRDYAQSWGSSRIFTPQLVVNGVRNVVASREDEVEGAVNTSGLELAVDIKADADMLDVSILGSQAEEAAVVWLVTYLDRAEVDVAGGENQGKKLVYTQIVMGRQLLGMWEPGVGAHFKLPLDEVLLDGSNGAAILVQQEHDGLPGRILGAASYTR